MKWILKKFDELTVDELYAILRLRNEVFGVEQHCVYLDVDNKDQTSYHLMGMAGAQLAAYTRIVPPGIIYEEASIGRVVTSMAHRRTGLGRELMKNSIRCLYDLFGNVPVRIGAQVYLLAFYASFGFTPQGDIYDEDGIDHVQMLLS